MAALEFDPCRLHVAAFANAGARLEGCWPLAQFDRLAASAVADAHASSAAEVRWSAEGERRKLRAGDAQIWLHLRATTALPLECQRCLKAVTVRLEIERSFLFVHGEDAAAQLDAQCEDDVLALTRALDLRELVEDELLLALPLVPRHDTCPQPLRDGVETGEPPGATEPAPASPFAALAVLKRPGTLN